MAEAQHNDFQAWQEYCHHASSSPKQSFDALRIAVPDFYESLNDLSRKLGAPLDGISTDMSGLAETRVPFNQAVKAVLLATNVPDSDSQQEYLAVAKKWLETPHPHQGDRTRAEIEAMLGDVQACIKDPSKLPSLVSQLKREE
jgi:hypothetical protein